MNEGERLVICMRQDEAILKQYILPEKVWKYYGENSLITKDKGYGVMISTFQSIEFGCSYPLMTYGQLDTVNDYHHSNNQYTDTIVASNIPNHTNKQPITPQESPFNKSFKYSTSTEGYCTYECMVLQVEDCRDVLIALHPKFDIIFLFNDYCGQNRGGEDGLNVN